MASPSSPLSKKLREVRSLRFELQHAHNRARWTVHGLEREEWLHQARIILWLLIDAEELARRLEYDINAALGDDLSGSLGEVSAWMAKEPFLSEKAS